MDPNVVEGEGFNVDPNAVEGFNMDPNSISDDDDVGLHVLGCRVDTHRL